MTSLLIEPTVLRQFEKRVRPVFEAKGISLGEMTFDEINRLFCNDFSVWEVHLDVPRALSVHEIDVAPFRLFHICDAPVIWKKPEKRFEGAVKLRVKIVDGRSAICERVSDDSVIDRTELKRKEFLALTCNQVSRACHGVEPWVFAEPMTIDDTAKSFARNLEGVHCRADAEDTLAISVQQPDRVLRVGGRKEISESGAMSMLQIDLINGWSWRKKDFSIYRVVAGDFETESRLVIIRAVDELRKIHRTHYRNQSDSFALAPWWDEFQTTFASRFVDAAENRILKLDDLLVEAERVPDMQFLAWLEDVEISPGSSAR